MSSKRISAVDVGGTFTDFVHWDGETLTTGKLPSTPDQSEAIAEGTGEETGLLLHGTTVATNALLERRGAKTMLVTNPGFEDMIEIGRQDRPSLYDTDADRAEPVVDREFRHGFVDTAEVARAIDRLQPESVAVALLESYRDPSEELDIGGFLADSHPDLAVSLSHQVNGEFREYERVSTTSLNAYLQPAVTSYLERLATRVQSQVLVMQSSGGLTSAAGASKLAASILLSGPAGGAVAAAACGREHGWDRVIAFDMGGTSTDVSRIEGGVPSLDSRRRIDGLACRMASVAIHTIGAGGGSIGWIDPGGALRVGPRSAGAWPGPAAYGRGGVEPTVTDANLALGHLGSEAALAAGTRLDHGEAERALGTLAQRLGLSPAEAAAGMVEVVNTHMEAAVRRVTVEEGADPRQAALVAFGGAGGLHASAIARRLDLAAVLVPFGAGVFSALGLLLSPMRHDLARTVVSADIDLDSTVRSLIGEAEFEMQAAIGARPDEATVSIDLRYRGQSHETNVAYVPGSGLHRLLEDFHRGHHQRNGFSEPEREVEVVTVRVAGLAPPQLTWDQINFRPTAGEARIGVRDTPSGTRLDRWWRPFLRPGERISGPAVIEETEATTLLGTGETALVLEDGTLEVTW